MTTRGRKVTARLSLAIALVLVTVPVLPAVSTFASGNDVVDFEDDNLEVAVREALGIEEPQPITVGDMAKLYELIAPGREIKSLVGLEHAVNLEALELCENLVTDIGPLADAVNLKQLHLRNNRVSDISALAKLSEMTRLNLYGNQVSDIGVLANLTNLEWLIFSFNEVSDLSALTHLTGLKALIFSGNQVSDVSPLAKLTSLEGLSLRINQVSDITPLANLTRLQKLSFSGNQVTDIGVLDSLPDLRLLYFCGNQVSDISVLAGLTRLETLTFTYNQVSDISALVANSDAGGLGTGDHVDMRHNYIDLTPGSAAMTDIETLEDRGVEVLYYPQRKLPEPLPVAAAVEVHPETLNLRAQGNWITAYVELPDPYDVEDIDTDTVRLVYGDESVTADRGEVQDNVLMVKFDQLTVAGMLAVGEAVEVFIVGEVKGVSFEASDEMRVIDPGQGRGRQE